MKKVDHLVARTFKGAMAFVLAVGLCPVAPAMAQEGATANEEGGTAAAAADGAGASTDGAAAGAAGGVAGSEADGVQPGGVSGDGNAAADGAGVGASAQDAAENDATDSDVSADVVEAAAAADGEADESNDAAAQTDGWQAWGGCEWMVDSEGCLMIRPKDGAEVGELPNTDYIPWHSSDLETKVRSIEIAKGVKASEKCCELFEGFENLEEADISNLDTSQVRNISWMFYGCKSMTSLDLSGLDLSGVVNYAFMFGNCTALKSLILPNTNSSNATNMSCMFRGCSSLEELDLSSFDFAFMADASSMFMGCRALYKIAMPKRLAFIDGGDAIQMFYGCEKLGSLDLSGMEAFGSLKTDNMLVDCSSLRLFSLPDFPIELPRVSGDGLSGRWICSTDGVAYSAYYSPALSGIYTAQNDSEYRNTWNQYRQCLWMVDDAGKLTIRPMPGTSGIIDSSYYDSTPWEAYSDDIKSLVVEEGVSVVGSATGLFDRLNNMAYADVSSLDVSGATDLSCAFQWCSSLEELDLTEWDVSKVTSLREMFYGCDSLQNLDLSGWDTQNVTDMSDMFADCGSLVSIDVSFFNTTGVERMMRMFSHCEAIRSLDLSSFDTSAKPGMYNMFDGCESLSSLDVSSFVLPDSVSDDVYSSTIFQGCDALCKIVVGEGFNLRKEHPNPRAIAGWTGEWVDQSGIAYGVDEIPEKTAGTYYAQIRMSSDMFEVDCNDSVYTGYEITKNVLSSRLLEGIDFDISYANNVYVGIASIDITGKGRVIGSLRYTFNIAKAIPCYKNPEDIEVTYGQTLSDVALPEGFSWQDDPSTSVGDPGEREFLATFTPGDVANYEVVRDVPVKVRVARDLDASMFSVDADGLVYDGSAHEPAVSSAVVPEGSYSVGYRDNVNAGEATAVVSGSGFYSGSCELKFAIAKAKPEYEIPSGICGAYGEPLSSVQLPAGYSWQDAPDRPIDWYGDKTLYATYSPADSDNYEAVNAIPVSVFVRRNTVDVPSVESLVYSGEKQMPAITLDSNVEVVTNEGGVDVGSYCVEFALKTPEFDRWSDGSFANKIVTYSINPLDITEAEVSVGEAYLENGKSEPSVSVSIAGSSLVQSRDYVLAYENNDALGEGIVKIQGKGNYSGTREVPFTILKNPVIAKGSCGQGVTYKIYDSGLMTIDGSGDVSFSGTNPPYSAAAKDVKVVIVDEGITSFCGFAFSGLKKCQAIFFKGYFVSGYGKYFKKEQYAFSGLNDNCRLYRSPGDATWSDRVAGKNCKPWVDGMLDIDWASMTEFGACGDESFWVLSNDGTLSVRGSGAVTDSAYGVQQRSLVSRLVVEDGITSIGDKFTISSYSYTGFENISSVTFADSVEELPAGMLRDCSSLQKIDLPSGIKAIPDKFLYGCTSLGSVQIPDAVTKIGEESFYGCSSLQSVSFGSSVDTIGAESFAKCASLAAISLPKTVASIGEKAFSETGVVKLVFPASVEEMDRSTFDKCPSLTKVVFEGAFPSFKGGSYSGNQIIGIHRANDETWQVRGKYNIGDITWYTENADGSLSEDNYISLYPSKELEMGRSATDYYEGYNSMHAYYFNVPEGDLVDISWWAASSATCYHWFYTISLKSVEGNDGNRIEQWSSTPQRSEIGRKTFRLDPGRYVIEVWGVDSHNDFPGFLSIGVGYKKRDLTSSSISLPGDTYEYTGNEISPKPLVSYMGETLVEGRDYNLTYSNNIAPGRGLAIAHGLGRYSGTSVYAGFDIVRSAGNYIALPGHWATGSGGWWYPYDNGGYPANEWCIIDGSCYHFDGSGYMQTGWLNLGGTWYYLSGSGIMQTGWQKIGGSWYWFDDSGAMATGWKWIDGSCYYFSGSGAMQTGWLNTGGAWYYLSDSGVMQTGWQVIGRAKYHFDGSGAMASGWSVIDGSYYYFDGSGAMKTGWLNRGGAWYWLGDSGVMATGWQTIGGAKYFFDDSGAMVTGWKQIDGSYYYFDGSGVMQTNKRIDGSYVGSDGRWDQNA